MNLRAMTAFSLMTALIAPLGARAEPYNAPTALNFPVNCEGVSYTITFNSGKANPHATTFQPAFFDGGTIVPLAFNVRLLAPDGSVVMTDTKAKGNTAEVFAGQTVECAFGSTDPSGFTLDGHVTVLIR